MKYLEDIEKGKVVDRYYINEDNVIVSQKHPEGGPEFIDDLNDMLDLGLSLEEIARHFSNAYSQLVAKEENKLPPL